MISRIAFSASYHGFFAKRIEETKTKGFGDWFFDYLKTVSGVKNLICKPLYMAKGWGKLYNPEMPILYKRIGSSAKNVKNGFAVAEILGKANELRKSIKDLGKVKLLSYDCLHKTSEIFFSEIPALINPVVETVKFGKSNRLFQLDSTIVQNLAKANAVGLFVGSLWGMGKEVSKINSTKINELYANRKLEEEKITLSLFKLAVSVSYLGLATLLTLSLFFGVTIAPWATLAFSTNALACMVIASYYEKTRGLENCKA